MKTILIALLVSLTGLELLAQVPPPPTTPTTPGALRTRQPRYLQNLPAPATTPAANATPGQPEETIPPGLIDFSGVDVGQVLDVYAKLVNRTILRANLPEAKIVLKTQTPLTRSEAIQALQAVLALNNISVVNIGEKFVKAAQSDQANTLGGELDRSGSSTNLPSLGTYVTHITQLKYVKPSLMTPLITPFSKLPNSVFAIDDNGILVIRDYAENVKRMLEMIEQIDVSVPAEFISEVIPIRYAKVDEIASALNSLGGGGGGTTISIGQGASSSPISGLANRNSGMAGMNSGFGGNNNMGGGSSGGSTFGNRTAASTANGTPSTGSSFQQRLQNIVNRAGSGGGGGGNQQDIQLFGQTKIIPNESSSTLLIYATRQDMAMIKEIIGKLDVPLSQVLIEAVIMDVNIGNSFSMGVTATQNPKTFYNPDNSSNILQTIAGAGGMNNGASLLNFLTQAVGTNGASTFGSSLSPGFSYFGNIGPTFDVAIQAAQNDKRASIIQRPRIQTSQAKAAQFFVGETRPYVTSTYNGYNGGSGGSSYSQLSVGVELDVTPFINPDGEVTMEIMQSIDDFNGFTEILTVGKVPNTIKRSLNTTITVRDRDTVMLGGFIRSDKSTSKAGVPFLQDIPLLGNLFTQRSDDKNRKELLVLVRPTVLKTPELAARQTAREAQRLPGVSSAAADDAAYEHKLVEAQRKRELRAAKDGSNTNGFFNVLMPTEVIVTNTVPPGAMPDHVLPPTPSVPDPTPASTLVDPSGTAMEQARAAAIAGVAAPVATPSTVVTSSNVKDLSPAQKKKLADLINERMTGKVTDEEYKKQRDAVLNAEK